MTAQDAAIVTDARATALRLEDTLTPLTIGYARGWEVAQAVAHLHNAVTWLTRAEGMPRPRAVEDVQASWDAGEATPYDRQ